jgi:hypothetical protein
VGRVCRSRAREPGRGAARLAQKQMMCARASFLQSRMHHRAFLLQLTRASLPRHAISPLEACGGKTTGARRKN